MVEFTKESVKPTTSARTAGTWGKGDLYFGFNVSRNFTLGKKNKKKDFKDRVCYKQVTPNGVLSGGPPQILVALNRSYDGS